MTCTVTGCDRKHVARGYCDTHYKRWRRNGDPGPTTIAPKGQPGRLCVIDGCGKPHFGHGYCAMHHRRWRRYGDPLLFQYERDANGLSKGTPSYHTMHKRLAKIKTGNCAISGCTRTNTEMALRHGCGHLVAMCGIYPVLYSDRPDEYLELCAQCHDAYDRGQFRLLGDAGVRVTGH